MLFPWPNRLEDGSYEFDGTKGRAGLDEPEHHNAIHGLVRWLPSTVEDFSEKEVRLSCTVVPQPAYRSGVAAEVTYAVSEGELLVTARAANQSTAAPFGLGFDPYLYAGSAGVDSCTLLLPARSRLRCVDRGLPLGYEDVEGTRYDLRGGVPLKGVQLDDCFTALSGEAGAPPDAAWEVLLVTGDGKRRGLWGGGLEVRDVLHRGHPSPAGRRKAVALEPTTWPPNVLRTGDRSSSPPGGSWSGAYGIRVLAGA